MAYAGLSACVCGCVLDISTNLTITSPSNHSIEQSILKEKNITPKIHQPNYSESPARWRNREAHWICVSCLIYHI